MTKSAVSNARTNSATPMNRLVTFENWDQPENLSWSYRHIREIMPTARVARGAHPSPLPRREAEGELPGVEELMGIEYTDGVLVLHQGSVVYEAYARGMSPDDTHILMSVSKSLTGTLAGILIERGALTPEDAVVTHLPELAGTSFEGASVRDLLDMRAGTAHSDDVGSDEWWSLTGWTPSPASIPDVIAYLASASNMQEHGGPFVYRTIITDVLGLVLERAGGAPFAELLGRELWGPMGAESDADIVVHNGVATAGGGICVTLRDFARFGQLMLSGKAVDGRQVVPLSFIEDTLRGAPDSAAAYDDDENAKYFPVPPGAHYRNQWWVPAGGRVLVGLGAHGQQLYIDRGTGVVIAMFSSWPQSHIAENRIPIFAAFQTIVDHLSAEAPSL